MNTRTFTLAATLLLCGAEANANDWKWSVTPYVWATDVGVDATIDDRRVADEEIAFEDLLEDLEAVGQVHVEAQRGAHGLMLDLFDVRLADKDDRVALPAGGEALLKSEIGMTIFEAGGFYDPRGDQQGFAFLYGTRILRQQADLDLTASVTRSYSVEDTLVDGLVGVRYIKVFSPRWSYQVRVDASAGGTEITWNAGSALSYTFGRNGRYSLLAGYRRMVVDFDTGDSADVDMTLSGFGIGLRTSF